MWWLYFAELSNSLILIFGFLTFVTVFLGSVWTCAWASDTSDAVRKPPLKSLITAVLVCSTIAIVLPSKETVYLMVGVKAADTLVNESELGEKVHDSLIKYFDTYLEE